MSDVTPAPTTASIQTDDLVIRVPGHQVEAAIAIVAGKFQPLFAPQMAQNLANEIVMAALPALALKAAADTAWLTDLVAASRQVCLQNGTEGEAPAIDRLGTVLKGVPEHPEAEIVSLREEVGRLRRLDTEYGRVETAIIMADPDFDGDEEGDAGDRLITSIHRLGNHQKRVQETKALTTTIIEAAMLYRSKVGVRDDEFDGLFAAFVKPEGAQA